MNEFLSYFFQSLPYAIAAALGILPPLLGIWIYRNYGAGLGVFVFAMLINAWLPNTVALDLGVRLYLMDLITLLMVPVVLLRLAFVRQARVHSLALYAFIAIVAINLAQGLLQFRSQAGVTARPDVYSLVALTYAMTFPADAQRVNTLMRALLWAVGGLFALVCFRWLAVGFQIDALLPRSGSFQPRGHSVWRVIISSETLLLAQIAVVGGFFAHSVPALRRWRALAWVLLISVVVLQHRSTWVALLAAIVAAVGLMFGRDSNARRVTFALLLVGAVGVAMVVGGAGGNVSEDVERSAGDAVELKGTAAERLGNWRQLVLKWSGGGARTLALGVPFGTNTVHYASDDLSARKIAYQAHNYYVTVLTELGSLGLAAYLLIWFQVLRGLLIAVREHGDTAALLFTLLAAQAAYYLTYGTDYVQALILGTALSYVAARKHEAGVLKARVAAAKVNAPARWPMPARGGRVGAQVSRARNP